MDLNITSDPLYAKISGEWNTCRYWGHYVDWQGSVYLDDRQLNKDSSDAIEKVCDHISDKLFKEYKQIDDYTFFEEF